PLFPLCREQPRQPDRPAGLPLPARACTGSHPIEPLLDDRLRPAGTDDHNSIRAGARTPIQRDRDGSRTPASHGRTAETPDLVRPSWLGRACPRSRGTAHGILDACYDRHSLGTTVVGVAAIALSDDFRAGVSYPAP